MNVFGFLIFLFLCAFVFGLHVAREIGKADARAERDE